MTSTDDDLAIGFVAGGDLKRVAQLEELSIDSLWTGGHVAAVNPSTEALMSLGRLSAATERVEVGTSILLLPLYAPAIVAKQIADLDNATGGRVVLGVGVGGEYPQEFRAGATGWPPNRGGRSEGARDAARRAARRRLDAVPLFATAVRGIRRDHPRGRGGCRTRPERLRVVRVDLRQRRRRRRSRARRRGAHDGRQLPPGLHPDGRQRRGGGHACGSATKARGVRRSRRAPLHSSCRREAPTAIPTASCAPWSTRSSRPCVNRSAHADRLLTVDSLNTVAN